MQVISDSFRVRKLETNSLRTSNLSMASRDCSEWKVGFTSNECRSLGRITRYAQKCCSRLPGAFWVCCRQLFPYRIMEGYPVIRSESPDLR
jgi:hypothetical protein